MSKDRDDESGRFAPTVEDNQILSHLRDHRKPSDRTAKAVGEAVGLDRSTAYRRLEQLVEREQVEKDELGKNVVYLPKEDESS
jgi:predicted transcriptional regulator